MAGVLSIAALTLTVPAVWSLVSGTAAAASLNHRWFVFFGVTWSILLLAVLHGPRYLQAPFAWMPLRWVGVVSFSVYLWHLVVVEALVRIGVQELPYPRGAVLAASLLVAAVSFLAFERPWRNVRLARPHTGLPAQGAGAGAGSTS